MAVIRGTAAAIDGVSQGTRWEVKYEDSFEPAISSAAADCGIELAGNVDWEGWYECYLATPPHKPNAAITFKGSADGTTGATGTAIVTATETTIPIKSAGGIKSLVRFGGNGALTLGASAASDATVAIPDPSKGLTISTGTAIAAPVYTEKTDVTDVIIRFWTDIVPYVTGGDAGVMKRAAGNMFGSVDIGWLTDDPSEFPAVGSFIALKVETTASLFWEILWCKVKAIPEYRAVIEGTEYVGGRVQCAYTGTMNISSVATRGWIESPGGVAWWGTQP